ncbi:MAG: MBL fold metallo-hydrolase [Gemmatimonadota bacterium]|nr:MAG: MBL fold metallo-hydrolase [Gemmatimonadota bacterium]
MKSLYASQPGLGNPTVHRLAEDVYAVTDLYHSQGPLAGVNAGIVFAPGAALIIDSGMTMASGRLLWELASARLEGTERLFLVLTHHHSDHVFGMQVFRDEGARVIGHRMVEDELRDDNGFYKSFIARMEGWTAEEADEILGDVVLSVPDTTIDSDHSLALDGEEVLLLVTPGHVDDEIVVFHPRSGTLFGGDAIYEGRPPNTRFGGPEEWRTWIGQLERLNDLDIGTIVPGHGKLSPKSLIDTNIEYLEAALDSVTQSGGSNTP